MNYPHLKAFAISDLLLKIIPAVVFAASVASVMSG
jgi:hypothetical protein